MSDEVKAAREWWILLNSEPDRKIFWTKDPAWIADYHKCHVIEFAEVQRLREELEKWKDEYNNVCKFATNYEQQRDTLRKENARFREVMKQVDERWWFNMNEPGRGCCMNCEGADAGYPVNEDGHTFDCPFTIIHKALKTDGEEG